jgi:hypothetical protein
MPGIRLVPKDGQVGWRWKRGVVVRNIDFSHSKKIFDEFSKAFINKGKYFFGPFVLIKPFLKIEHYSNIVIARVFVAFQPFGNFRIKFDRIGSFLRFNVSCIRFERDSRDPGHIFKRYV